MKKMVKRLLSLVVIMCLWFGLLGSPAIAMDMIQSTTDFDQENLSSGDFITDQLEGVSISTRDTKYDAMIFDTDDPTGNDSDWAESGQGNVLIISEDGDSFDPDDSLEGGTIRFDWDEPVDIETISLLDIERSGSTVTVFDIDGNSQEFDALAGPNGNLQKLDIDVDNVKAMEVFLSSTGAIANIVSTSSSK